MILSDEGHDAFTPHSTSNQFTVQQALAHLNTMGHTISHTALYDHIKKGDVNATRTRGKLYLDSAGIERMRQLINTRRLKKDLMEKLTSQGRSTEAARKLIQRGLKSHMTIGEIELNDEAMAIPDVGHERELYTLVEVFKALKVARYVYLDLIIATTHGRVHRKVKVTKESMREFVPDVMAFADMGNARPLATLNAKGEFTLCRAAIIGAFYGPVALPGEVRSPCSRNI